MVLGRLILQGNMELHSMKVDEQEGCCQINNRVLSTARIDPDTLSSTAARVSDKNKKPIEITI